MATTHDVALTELPNGAKAIAPADYSKVWKAQHNRHIGSSDAAAACGRSQYQQPFDIYNQKITGISEIETKEMRRGTRYEGPIAEEYAERYDMDLIYPLAMFEHPEHQFIAATPDAMPADCKERKLVEIKLCNYFRARQLGEQETDEVFDDWLIQAQHQLWTTGFDVVEIFVCLDHSNHKLFRVERNDKLIAAIAKAETKLWSQVQKGTPPPLNFFHDSVAAIVEAIPLRTTIEHPEEVTDANLLTLSIDYQQMGQQIKVMEKARSAVKAQLQALLDGRPDVIVNDRYRLRLKDVEETVVPEHTRRGYRRLDVRETK